MNAQQEQAAIAALIEIRDRADFECDTAKRRGEKQGNYRNISNRASAALRYWSKAELETIMKGVIEP
jgi:hypothetical protein